MKESLSTYFESQEFIDLLNSYEDMIQGGTRRYFDGLDISNIAQFYNSVDDDDKAMEAIRYGLELHPGDADILMAEGHIMLKQGRSDEARAIAESVTDGDRRELLFLKGSIELFDENTSMANLYFQQAVEEGDEDMGLYADIIALFIDYVQYDFAQDWIDKATAIDSEYSEIIEMQADLDFATQDYDKAIELYNRLLDESPYEIYYWEQLVCIYYRLEDWANALDCFEYIEAIDPMYSSMGMIKAECLLETDQAVRAERILRKAMEAHPDSSDVLFLLGNALSLQERHEEAIPYVERAIRLNPDDRQMNIMLAGEYYHCDRFKEAAKSLTTAFRAGFTTNPDTIRMLVLSLLREDDTRSVYIMLKALIEIPDLDYGQYGVFVPGLAMCCWQMGYKTYFKKYFGKSYDMNPVETLHLFGITDDTVSKEQAVEILLRVCQNEASQINKI